MQYQRKWRWSALILALVVAIGCLFTPLPARAAAVRIMPLGDSITGSPGCWRAILWNQLQAAGYTSIDFVGTLGPQGCALSYDGDNEGHGGALVSNVASQNQLPAWLSATNPDVVLMHFGTNDVWSNIAADTILASYSTLIDQMRANNPHMIILVAQIIPLNPSTCSGCAQRAVTLNAAIPAWASAKSTAQSPIIVVDQWSGFDTATDTYDGVHPNDAGNQKMANRWFPALAAALSGTTLPTSVPPTATAVTSSPTTPPSVGVCQVNYVLNQWSAGFTADVKITNNGAATTNWTLTWSFSGNQQISSAWNAIVTQSGSQVTVKPSAGWNATLPAGGSQSFGFQASYSGSNAVPTNFALNGLACNGATQPTPTSVPATATRTATSIPATATRTATSVPATATRTATSLPVTATRTATIVPATATRTATSLPATATHTPTPSAIVPSATPSNTGPCQVTYSIVNQWQGGFQANIVIKNSSATALPNWTLTWSFLDGQTITQAWDAVVLNSGPAASVTNTSYNATIPAGGTVAFGFTGSSTNNNSKPTAFSLNGRTCSGSPTSSPTPSPIADTPPPIPTSTPVVNTPTPIVGSSYIGNATYFDGLGSPYGGCGVPQASIDSQNFVALNVQNTPNDYATFLPRPIPAQNAASIGAFDNGRNCGRWVRVTIGDICTGVNDGASGQPFCRNGVWSGDTYNGATLDMLVADSCQDGNAWCRDDRYHLDLSKASLSLFSKNGQVLSDMYPNHWNNRHVSWQYIPAPNYQGDIGIGFMQGASIYWSAIAITHLPNGIHSVEYLANGTWHSATMNKDMGQSYIIAPTTTNGTAFTVRVYDVNDQLINAGRQYSFSLPASCGQQCSAAYTPITYVTQ